MSARWSKIPWPFIFIGRKDLARMSSEAYLRAQWSLFEQSRAVAGEDNARLNCLGLDVLYRIVTGDALHIFLDTEALFEFLRSTAVKDVAPVGRFLTQFGVYRDAAQMNAARELLPMYSGAHPPKQAPGFVLYAAFHHRRLTIPSYLYALAAHEDGAVWRLYWLDDERIHQQNPLERPDSDAYRLIVNLCHYISHFGDCVREAPPEDHLDGWRPRKRYRLVSHPEVVEHGVVSPHFRSGHWRVLRDEYFTHKRGESVWIHESFVRGEPITVLDDPTHRAEMGSES